jgi:PatG Domain
MIQSETPHAPANGVGPTRGTDEVIASQSGVVDSPAVLPEPCPTCGGGVVLATPSYVYAIGRVEARFADRATEMEFGHAARRSDTAGKTDHQTFHAVLSKGENRYLVRQLCWVLTVQGLETYLLVPRNPADIDLLLETLRPAPSPNDVDVVIGRRGPIAPPQMCNGLMVPIVAFDQIYSFDRDALIKAIPKPEKVSAEKFRAAAEEVFNRIIEVADNAGATDENRAVNFLLMRDDKVYAAAASAFERDFSLSGVEVRPSPLNGLRRHVDVIFSYTDRKTDFTEKLSARVDVHEEFPFLVKKLSPYYDH